LSCCVAGTDQFRYPETRDRYLTRLRALLDEVWSEQQIISEIESFRALLQPRIENTPRGEQELIQTSIDDVVEFVRGRRKTVEDILDAAPTTWDRPLRPSWCLHDSETDGP
jgi:hypothetical protein